MENRLFGILFGILFVAFLAGCSGGGGGSGGGGNPGGSASVVLTSVEVTPGQPSIAHGTTVQFTAIGIYSDLSKKDVTSTVTWKSSNASIATINAQGLATSAAVGTTNITATLGDTSKTVVLTVTPANLLSIKVYPSAASIAKGTSQQFTAMGTFSDSTTQDLTTQVAWTSTAPAIASIGATGLATSRATGSTTITATLASVPGVTGTASLQVTSATLASLEVTPANPSIAVGTTLQFKATGIFSDNTKQDLTASSAWSSSTTAVSITGGGLATGVAVGSPTITATFGGVTGTSTLTVTSASLVTIEVTPLNPSIARGTGQQFAAIGTFTNNTKQDLTTAVTWLSSNTGVATISNATGSIGVATSPANGPTGSTTITAALGGVSGQTHLNVTSAVLQSIDVEPSSPTLPKGVQQPFTATGTFSDGTTVTTQDMTAFVIWSSDNPATATVSDAPGSKGVAVTVADGTANITATFGSVTGSTQLTVQSDTLLSIEVTPTDPTIPLSLTQQFTATGIYANIPPVDLTSQATWSSSPGGIAIISNDGGSAGLAKPVASGKTTITATFSGVSGNTSLTVNAATLTSIAVNPVSSSIAKGTTRQFTATGTFSDNSTLDITQLVVWTSTVPSVAVISNAANNEGVATGMAAGTTTIKAALASVVSNNATLTVTNANLQSIAINPANSVMAVKTNLQFTATGTFSDTTQQDLTKLVVWGTSNKSIAAISNATGTKGLATGVSFGGPITISAAFAGISGTTGLTVATGTLTGITILPPAASVTIGSTLQFQAVGTYSFNGGSFQQDLTRQVIWNSSDTNVAVTNNGLNSRGLVTATGTGTTSISARKPSHNVPIVPALLTVTP